MALGLQRLWGLRGTALASIERFPAALLALGAFVVFVNLEIAGVIAADDLQVFRAAGAAGAAAAIAAAVVLYGERRGFGLIAQAVSFASAALFGVSVLAWERFGVASPALVAAAVLLVPLAPYIRGGRIGFWAFIWTLINAGVLAFLAVVVFCLGVSAILASLQYLFGLDIDSSLYGHIWSIGLGFVGPLFALSLVPRAFPAEDRPHEIDIVVTGVRVLSDFVAVPLLATYALILHVYAAKILIGGELPKNRLGWMVLSFGLCTLALRIFVHPLGDIARLPTRLFLRWWALPLVVPLGLLVTAAWQRIAGYGFTPQRYALALFALFLGLVLLAQVTRRMRGDIRVIPALGAICLLLASFGPWGMIRVSAELQTNRLVAYLEGADALAEGTVSGVPAFERAAAEEVQSIIGVLDEIGQLDRLRPLFAGQADDPFALAMQAPAVPLAESVRKRLNVYELPTLPDASGSFWLEPTWAAALPIDDYDVVVANLNWNNAPPAAQAVVGLPLSVELNREGVAVIEGGRRTVFPVPVLRAAIAERISALARPPSGPRPPLFVEAVSEGRRMGLFVQSAGGFLNEREFSLHSGNLTLFLRRADWSGS